MELTRDVRDKRVAVMKDVLAQLARTDVPLKLKRRVYLGGMVPEQVLESIPDEGDLQDHVDLLQRYCEACAIGSAFLSCVRLFDGFPLSSISRETYSFDLGISPEDMRPVIESIFDTETLTAMEAFFDQRFYSDDCWDEESEDSEGFYFLAADAGRRFSDPADALRTIAQIFIDNDGEFLIPTPAPEVAR